MFTTLVKRHRWLVCIIGIMLVIFVLSIAKHDLMDWDECIYAQYSKTMKETGNLLTFQWLGLPRLEKPPLLGWILQVPYFFGINEFSSRILSVIASLALLVSVYIYALKFFSQRTALFALLILLGIREYLFYSVKLNTDIFYSLFIFLGYFFFLLSFERNFYSFAAGVAFAGAVMIKGPGIAAYLLVLFLTVFIRFRKDRFVNFLTMVLTMLLLILPWHLYEYTRFGENFVNVYIRENLIQKVRYPVEFHFGGNLYYFSRLLKEVSFMLPGLMILPVYFFIDRKKHFPLSKLVRLIRNNAPVISLSLMVILPVFFLTTAKTKISWYLMPVYPFISLLIGVNLDFFLRKIAFNKAAFNIQRSVVGLLLVFCVANLSFELKPWQIADPPSPRNEVAKIAKRYPGKTMDYLVQFSERRGREVLMQSPNLYTSTTFIYGGNPCAVYYSGKNIVYYYSPEQFQARILKKAGLYLVENGDLHYIEKLPVKILYNNSDFTLFEN